MYSILYRNIANMILLGQPPENRCSGALGSLCPGLLAANAAKALLAFGLLVDLSGQTQRNIYYKTM